MELKLPNKKLLEKFLNNELNFNNASKSIYLCCIQTININNLLLVNGLEIINRAIYYIAMYLQKNIKYRCLFGLNNENQILGVINFSSKIEKKQIRRQIIQFIAEIKGHLRSIDIKLIPRVYLVKVLGTRESFEDNLTNIKLMQEEATNKTVVFFNKNLRKIRERQELIERGLYKAIQKKDIYTVVQPKIKVLANGSLKIYGAELLMRWHDPFLGEVSPNEFIPIAEKSRLIDKLGVFLLETLEQYNTTLTNLQLSNAITFSINISARQVTDNLAFIRKLINKIEKIKPIFFLSVEITETSFMENFHLIEKVYKLLKPHNIDLSIDDFGTGYSSLKYISHGCFNKIKIDSVFVQNLNQVSTQHLLKMLVDLANTIEMDLIIEGVENEEQ